MRKQRFSKQRAISTFRVIGLMLSGYWQGLVRLFGLYRELPIAHRIVYILFAGIPTLLIVTAIVCWDVYVELHDPLRCLIWGVPPPMAAEEKEFAEKATSRLLRLEEAIHQNTRERYRQIRRRSESREEEQPLP
jgi:hypothetical protein